MPPKRVLLCCSWDCGVEPKSEGVVVVWFCCVLVFPNKDGVVDVCCVDAPKSDGFACCAPPNNPPDGAGAADVLAPNAPPKRPPLAGADDWAVDEPKRPPLAGAAAAGLFMLLKRPPDAGCDTAGCVDPPKRPPDWLGCAAVEPKRPPPLAGWEVAVADALFPKRLPPVLMLRELERPKPAISAGVLVF